MYSADCCFNSWSEQSHSVREATAEEQLCSKTIHPAMRAQLHLPPLDLSWVLRPPMFQDRCLNPCNLYSYVGTAIPSVVASWTAIRIYVSPWFLRGPTPKGSRGCLMSTPMSGTSRLTFDSPFLSPLLFFCLVLLLFLSCHLSPKGPF